MHSGRAGWASQTFALAKCSDSNGKKHRNRMSKEDRRKMAESFIKRHRDSNNGNFPSLNLTHKQVGGSFYTVREIVREIIQENRVLCPGNLTSPSFMLDDSSVITVEPSSMERREKDPETPPAYSSMIYDHNTPDDIKADFDRNSNGVFNRSVNGDSGDGILDGIQVIGLSSMQVGSDQEIRSIEDLSSSIRVSSSIADDQKNAERTLSDSLKPLASSSIHIDEHKELELVMAGTIRESSNFQQKNPGENPIWIVIKGFVASFIKFWVE